MVIIETAFPVGERLLIDEDKSLNVGYAHSPFTGFLQKTLRCFALSPHMPIYHRLDKRIGAHIFMCVMDPLFHRYIQWKVEKATSERVPIGMLAAQLSRIKLSGLITGGDEGRKVRFRLENRDERMLVKALNLERFVPNKT